MTRRVHIALVLVALIALAEGWGYGVGRGDICPLTEVRAGQVAVVKSVFEGTKIESFRVEIIGVLHQFDGTRSIILGRVLDGPVVTRKTGIIGGMSGSPVYVKGRLVGAIAYAWPWSKEPITGITPIEDMLDAWEGESAARAAGASAGGLPQWPPLRLGGKPIGSVRLGPAYPEQPDPPGVMTLVPLGGVAQVSGFGRRAVEQLSELMAPYGVRVVQGPGGGAENLRPPMVPGAVLGCKLVDGDLSMVITGTVTMVEGDRVLGFGHPMFQLGALDVPMTGGYVHGLLSSLYISSKMTAPSQVIGRLTRDHQSAVAGRMGERADLLPVEIEVADHDLRRSRKFAIGVARIREMLPSLVASGVLTAVDETRGRVARGTARVSVEIEAAGRPPIKREDFGYSEHDAAGAAAPAVLSPLMMFTDNPLGELDLRHVRVRVECEDARRTAVIERVTIGQSRVKAGDEVSLTVRLRPYGKEPVEIPVGLPLPGDLPRGRVRVVVSAGDEATAARGAIGAPIPSSVSLDQLIERFVTEDRGCDLVVQAALTRGGISLLGEELPDLPRSKVEALRATSPTDLRPAPTVVKVVVPTDWALRGRRVASFQVESDVKPAPPAVPGPPKDMPEEEEEEEPTARIDIAAPEPAAWAGLSAEAGNARTSEAAKGPDKDEAAKPMARAPEAWVHRERKDYVNAALEGVALAENGALSLAPNAGEPIHIPAEMVWCAAVAEGSVYVGTGNQGGIYRVSPDGEVSDFFSTGELSVNSLCLDGEGNLYAATSPRGKLFRIAPEGKGEVWYDSDSAHLWSLVMDPEGRIYAAAGSPARIYAVAPSGEGSVLAELPVANVLSLARTESGDLYAGTSDLGIIYRISPEGGCEAVCQVSGQSVDALAVAGDGTVYAGTSPGGEVYAIRDDSLPSLFCTTGQGALYGLAALPDGSLMAATGPVGLVLRIGAGGKPQIVHWPESGLATAVTEADGAVYVGSSAPCVLRRLGPEHAASGALKSAALDVGRPAHWGRILLTSEVPEGTEVSVETRAGNSPDPDDHWSPWVTTVEGAVMSPAARHLQYRLNLRTDDPQKTPVVRQIEVSWRPQNREPDCKLTAPEPGARLSKKSAIKWQARDPDKDTLLHRVEISRDLGETWKELEKDLKEQKCEWDTTESEDGRYWLRVTASDRQSAPEDPRTAEAQVFVWVDNTAPEVLIFRSSVSVTEAGTATLTGMAQDTTSPIRSIEYRVGDGEWQSVALFAVETSVAAFAITTDALDAGEHVLEARAFDAAGNVGTDKVTVKVPEEAKAKPAEAVPETAHTDAEG